MPLFGPELLIVTDECTKDEGADWPKLTWVVDNRDETNPVPVATLPLPPVEALPLEPGRGLARLPEPSPGDVYLDFEGDPFVGDHGLEYLTGYAWRDAKGKLQLEQHWALDAASEYAVVRGLASVSFPLGAPVLSFRAGGAHLFGDAPYFEWPQIGGSEDLRGFVEDRFTGRSAVWGGAHLRVRLTDFFALMIPAMVPFLLAAQGTVLSGRAGLFNVSQEGLMVLGASVGFLVSFKLESNALGLLAAGDPALGAELASYAAAGVDIDEGTIPHESGLVPESVDFGKGCFLGQEAVATGVCAALREDDVVTSTHRGHGHRRGRRLRRARIPRDLLLPEADAAGRRRAARRWFAGDCCRCPGCDHA